MFKELYEADMYRYGKIQGRYLRKFHYYFRKCQSCNIVPIKYWYRFCFLKLKQKRGIEISSNTKIRKRSLSWICI